MSRRTKLKMIMKMRKTRTIDFPLLLSKFIPIKISVLYKNYIGISDESYCVTSLVSTSQRFQKDPKSNRKRFSRT